MLYTVLYLIHLGVAVITQARLHSSRFKLRLCAGSNPARGVLEIHNSEDF